MLFYKQAFLSQGGALFEKFGFDKTGIGPQGIGRWPWKNLKKHLPKKQAMEGGFIQTPKGSIYGPNVGVPILSISRAISLKEVLLGGPMLDHSEVLLGSRALPAPQKYFWARKYFWDPWKYFQFSLHVKAAM